MIRNVPPRHYHLVRSCLLCARCPAGSHRLAPIHRRRLNVSRRWSSNLRSDIEFLSSEDLRGRGVDDGESIAKAAQYIADRMESIGLDTSLYDGSPFQKVPLTLDAS